MMSFRELVVSSYPARANDIVKAVHLLRQHGIAVGFPMQTADGEIIFPVGKDFTLTADQMLELLERVELDADGVRRSVEAQAATRRRAASSYRDAAVGMENVMKLARSPASTSLPTT